MKINKIDPEVRLSFSEGRGAIIYINGDKAEYTGATQVLYDKTWYEVEIVEGHRAGEIAGTYRAPAAA